MLLIFSLLTKRAAEGIKSRASECHDKPGVITQDASVNISDTVLLRLPHKEAMRERIKRLGAVDGLHRVPQGSDALLILP